MSQNPHLGSRRSLVTSFTRGERPHPYPDKGDVEETPGVRAYTLSVLQVTGHLGKKAGRHAPSRGATDTAKGGSETGSRSAAGCRAVTAETSGSSAAALPPWSCSEGVRRAHGPRGAAYRLFLPPSPGGRGSGLSELQPQCSPLLVRHLLVTLSRGHAPQPHRSPLSL